MQLVNGDTISFKLHPQALVYDNICWCKFLFQNYMQLHAEGENYKELGKMLNDDAKLGLNHFASDDM